MRNKLIKYIANSERPWDAKYKQALKARLAAESFYPIHNLPYNPFNATADMEYNLGFSYGILPSFFKLENVPQFKERGKETIVNLPQLGVTEKIWKKMWLKERGYETKD